jgi:hypothetical protein
MGQSAHPTDLRRVTDDWPLAADTAENSLGPQGQSVGVLNG